MEKYLSPKVLKARLRENGHQVCLVPGTGSHVGIAFAPKTIMTVALYTDPTLRKRFRNSFFLCNWKRPGSVLKELGCPKEFSRNWTSVLSALRPGEDKDFLASAATWTLGRLVCHKRVLMWANAETSLSRAEFKTLQRKWSISGQLPKLFKPTRGRAASGAYLFARDSNRFLKIFALACLLSERSYRDFFLADEGCTEVHQLHHHEKVMVSVPDRTLRKEALKHLRCHPNLYQNVSGYC